MSGTEHTEPDPLVAVPQADLRKNLTGTEELQLNLHQHPMSLWRPAALLLAALTLVAMMLRGDRLPLLAVLLVLAALGNLAWREYERRHNSFAATDRRVLRVEGVINKSFPMMRLQKITDMRLDQPLIGRLVGYGTITIESAGQDQAIREFRYAPHPTQAYRRLNAIIFGEEWAGPEPEFRHPPARRAASATARGARRAVGASRQGLVRVTDRRPATNAAPALPKAGKVNSPIQHHAGHSFFGTGDHPQQPPARRRRPGRPAPPSDRSPKPPRTAGPANDASRRTTTPPKANPAPTPPPRSRPEEDTGELPILRPRP